jgi:hypothetical protein
MSIRTSALTVATLFTIVSGGMSRIAPARADAIVSLEGVQFADGGTASGTFSLNVLNYLSGENIATTDGTSGSPPFNGITYTPVIAGQHTPASPMFTFNSAGYAWILVLDFATVLTGATTGIDELIPGGGSGGNYTGSYEECVNNSTACGGFAYQSVRFVTAGGAQIPEPPTLAILSFAAIATFATRRLSRQPA